jgi:hypothetical protein
LLKQEKQFFPFNPLLSKSVLQTRRKYFYLKKQAMLFLQLLPASLSWPTILTQSFSPFSSQDGQQVRRPNPTRATNLFSKI